MGLMPQKYLRVASKKAVSEWVSEWVSDAKWAIVSAISWREHVIFNDMMMMSALF
jgi:hypothetical protein